MYVSRNTLMGSPAAIRDLSVLNQAASAPDRLNTHRQKTRAGRTNSAQILESASWGREYSV